MLINDVLFFIAIQGVMFQFNPKFELLWNKPNVSDNYVKVSIYNYCEILMIIIFSKTY